MTAHVADWRHASRRSPPSVSAPAAPPRIGRRQLARAAAVPTLAASALLAGALLHGAGAHTAGWLVWMSALIGTGAVVAGRTAHALFAGRLVSDVIAALAVIASVTLDQPLAGLVIVIMQSGGEALERYAEGRASAAVRSLEKDAPRFAHRVPRASTELIEEVAVADVAVGDALLVRPGEMIPCDGVVIHGTSHVVAARLTGEPIPIAAREGVELASGSLNIDGPLSIRAKARAADSQYARIVELVRCAQASKAPIQRLADRYAVWFTPVTLGVAAAAFLASRDWQRVLAVLVVATPCPLIIATPVAIIGGINRAAREFVVVRNGGALEHLATVTAAVFDKTGTLTVGQPEVSRVIATDGIPERELLELAASVEQRSGHLLARSVARAARDAAVPLRRAERVTEVAGLGVRGVVDGREVAIGARSFAEEARTPGEAEAGAFDPNAQGLRAYVVVDGQLRGVIEFADRIRPGLRTLFAELQQLGLRRNMLLSGDSEEHTAAVAQEVGIQEAHGELLPADKVAAVRGLQEMGERVLMVGDGTNDAPALSAATVGVALAAYGGGITAEAADVVILADDVTRVADAVRIGRRTVRIARQSILVGLGLSAVAMLTAALGDIPPVAGAVLQEGLDVAVIVNALRASQ